MPPLPYRTTEKSLRQCLRLFFCSSVEELRHEPVAPERLLWNRLGKFLRDHMADKKLSFAQLRLPSGCVRLRQIFRATLIRNSKNLLIKKYSDNNIVKVKSVFWKNCTKKVKLPENVAARVSWRKNLSTILGAKKWGKCTYTRICQLYPQFWG